VGAGIIAVAWRLDRTNVVDRVMAIAARSGMISVAQPQGADRSIGRQSAVQPIHLSYLRRLNMTKASSRAAAQKRSSGSSSKVWWFVILGGGAVITVVVILLLLQPPAPVGALEGMLTYNNLSRAHSEAPQTYPQTPPAGGVHSAVWQNCGVYDQPVRNENAVHSLEHGAVWIAYRPDLPEAAVQTLRTLARGRTHVLVAPYPDLPQPIVATAWGLQLPLQDASDSRLPVFVSRYEKGPQTPEPGAVCTGGTGTPIAS
jgi:hypothetical protein